MCSEAVYFSPWSRFHMLHLQQVSLSRCVARSLSLSASPSLCDPPHTMHPSSCQGVAARVGFSSDVLPLESMTLVEQIAAVGRATVLFGVRCRLYQSSAAELVTVFCNIHPVD